MAASPRDEIGYLVEGKSDIVLRDLSLQGHHHNLVLRGCRNVVVAGGDFSGSFQPELFSQNAYDERDWLDIFDETVWRGYSAGIVLEDCENCTVLGARANGAQNGLWLVGCRDCTVSGCDFSRNSGWGIWMWRSHGNTITRNNCDWCVRCEDPQHYSAGGDSAGLMLSNDNCRNVITHNSFRYSGDGFFLNGLRVPPSEDNLIAFNDGSHSPHNAFESSFSGGNRFIGNIANNSRFGFWCGYSHHNEFIGNIIENCLEWGIAIEHGYSNRILGNELRRNRQGIVLFSPGDEGPQSRDYVIEGNVIGGTEAAMTLSRTSRVVARHNYVEGDLCLKEGATDVTVQHCDISGNVTRGPDCAASLDGCYLAGTAPAALVVQAALTQPHGPPGLPVTAQPANPIDRDDHTFHWYDRRKQPGTLVGTAQV